MSSLWRRYPRAALGTGIALFAAVLSVTACNEASQTSDSPATKSASADFSRGMVGKPAAGFTLNDADGKPVNVDTLLGTKPVVLVIYRGNW